MSKIFSASVKHPCNVYNIYILSNELFGMHMHVYNCVELYMRHSLWELIYILLVHIIVIYVKRLLSL